MEQITLKPMTKELSRRYHREFMVDPDLFRDPRHYKPYVYTDANADETVDRYESMGRVYMAVMLQDKPIGEVILKKLDRKEKHCTLGISMVNDAYKNKGYGTQAEKLILKFAFEELEMKTVFADALVNNLRSQHVLEKVGFKEICRDADFVYYRCDRRAAQG